MGYYSVNMYGFEFEDYLIGKGVSEDDARGYIDIIYLLDLASSDKYPNNIKIFNDGSERFNHFYIGVEMDENATKEFNKFKLNIPYLVLDIKKNVTSMMQSSDPDVIESMQDCIEELNEYIPTKSINDYFTVLDGFVAWSTLRQPKILSGIEHG